MRGSRSAQGLASVGLGNFKIGALHDLMSTEAVPEDDGFCPGGFAVPQSFKGKRGARVPVGYENAACSIMTAIT